MQRAPFTQTPPPGQTNPAWLTIVQLWVGYPGSEELVRTWTQGPEIPVQIVSLAVMFDSSHFINSSYISVKITATDTYARNYQATAEAVNKNRATCWNHPDADAVPGGNGADVAEANLLSMNYSAVAFHGNWTPPLVTSQVFGSVAYFNTHGDVNYLETGDGLDFFGIDYLYSRGLRNGTGFPPFNSTELPAHNIVLLEVCNACDDESFHTALWPHSTAYPGPIDENQALHGYDVFTFFEDSEVSADQLFKSLRNGARMIVASAELVDMAPLLGILCLDENSSWSEEQRRPLNADDVMILGDPYACAKNVYTGTASDLDTWFRPIPPE